MREALQQYSIVMVIIENVSKLGSAEVAFDSMAETLFCEWQCAGC